MQCHKDVNIAVFIPQYGMNEAVRATDASITCFRYYAVLAKLVVG